MTWVYCTVCDGFGTCDDGCCDCDDCDGSGGASFPDDDPDDPPTTKD